MREEQSILVTYWWEKLTPLRRKFVRETILGGLEKEDLEQECFIQLHRAVERYNPELGVPFESYYKIALYGWRANQNRVKARKELAFGDEEFAFMQDERVDVEKDVEEKILAEEVIRSLELLEEKERRIIEAYYFKRMKMLEIANALEMPVRTAQNKKKKALNKLREILSSHRQ